MTEFNDRQNIDPYGADDEADAGGGLQGRAAGQRAREGAPGRGTVTRRVLGRLGHRGQTFASGAEQTRLWRAGAPPQ